MLTPDHFIEKRRLVHSLAVILILRSFAVMSRLPLNGQGETNLMFSITGITGKVGGEVARNLLAGNQSVRAVVRDLRKGEAWAQLGCDLVRADINDAGALTSAFKGAESVFVLVPPNFDPSPDFHEARATAATLRSALAAARPGRVVYLSTIGAQATQSNLLTQHTIIEQCLRVVDADYLLRPGWFRTVAAMSLRRPMTA
jgi:uncharacterized protein YbjT (DUF2867 family)